MAFLAGAFFGMWMLTRLLRRFAFRHLKGNAQVWTVSIVAYVLSGFLASLGMADGGPPQFAQAFGSYLIPAIFWLVYDLVKVRRAERAAVGQATP